MRRLFPLLPAVGWLLVFYRGELTPVPPAAGPAPQRAILEGHRFYFEGRHAQALESYEKALRGDDRLVEAWVNGAVVAQELEKTDVGAEWLRKASQLSPADLEIATALGEAELNRGDLQGARAALAPVLSAKPRDVHALTALGRIELASDRPEAAARALAMAAREDPGWGPSRYWLGKAREAAGDLEGAVEAFREAVAADSYFTMARYELGRTLVKAKRFDEAWPQVGKVVNAAPGHAVFRLLERQARPGIGRGPGRAPATKPSVPAAAPAPMIMSYDKGRVPILRVGVGTTPLGKPLPRRSVRFKCKTRFQVVDEQGRLLLKGPAGEEWELRLAEGKKALIEVRAADGKLRLKTARTLRVRPDGEKGGITTIKDVQLASGGGETASRRLRGDLEVGLYPGRRALKMVNVVDLESYTHGVLAAEMPVASPMEALKAQAVVARTHALFIKTVTRRHQKDGYDLCDGQHCQVYSGVRIESGRSRAVVDKTRGRVVSYLGRLAHVLYSSNCGGHLQAGREVHGWGDIPYWQAILDAPPEVGPPNSPWELRRWLRGSPPVYCRPSGYVHRSHFRWGRVIPAADLEERINRSARIGRLLAVDTLKRSASGHLNSVRIRGSLGSVTVNQEIKIRGLLGVGSQRSALFVLETERDALGRPKAFIFHGAGWGHGVGMCQSGAMGRAEQGQSYADILRAYYPGTELGDLRY